MNTFVDLSQVHIGITVNRKTSLQVVAINFLFHDMLPCRQSLVKRGSRLASTKQERLEPAYGNDSSLTLKVVDRLPRLEVEVLNGPVELLQGECHDFDIQLQNPGQDPIQDVHWVTNIDGYLVSSDTSSSGERVSRLVDR